MIHYLYFIYIIDTMFVESYTKKVTYTYQNNWIIIEI